MKCYKILARVKIEMDLNIYLEAKSEKDAEAQAKSEAFKEHLSENLSDYLFQTGDPQDDDECMVTDLVCIDIDKNDTSHDKGCIFCSDGNCPGKGFYRQRAFEKKSM